MVSTIESGKGTPMERINSEREETLAALAEWAVIVSVLALFVVAPLLYFLVSDRATGIAVTVGYVAGIWGLHNAKLS